MNEQSRLQDIPPRNFTKQQWSKADPTKAPELKKLIDHFNWISGFVQTLVVSENDKGKRAVVIGKCIAIAEELLAMHNYNSLYAMVAGLGSSPVWRLKQSWPLVEKKRIEAFTQLQDIVTPLYNYRALRERFYVGCCLTLERAAWLQAPHYALHRPLPV